MVPVEINCYRWVSLIFFVFLNLNLRKIRRYLLIYGTSLTGEVVLVP